jgi:large subunit ribosomal protein L17
MRHQNSKVHLNRTTSHRKALLANMACCLIKEKQIRTTVAKARAVRPFVERMITFARKGDLASRRHVLKHIRQKAIVKTLFETIGPFYADRNGGYTRIVKLGQRRGDAAPVAILELVDREAMGGEKKKKAKAATAKKTKQKVEKESKPEAAAEES